ncbi:hypothetical protein TKK_0015804 [Trichogramma kaykai]
MSKRNIQFIEYYNYIKKRSCKSRENGADKLPGEYTVQGEGSAYGERSVYGEGIEQGEQSLNQQLDGYQDSTDFSNKSTLNNAQLHRELIKEAFDQEYDGNFYDDEDDEISNHSNSEHYENIFPEESEADDDEKLYHGATWTVKEFVLAVGLLKSSLGLPDTHLSQILKFIEINIQKVINRELDQAANVSVLITNRVKKVAKAGAVFIRKKLELNCLGIPVGVFSTMIDILSIKPTLPNDVKFYFHSKLHPNKTIVTISEIIDLRNVDFDVTRNTFAIVHGFMSSGEEDWLKEMKDALLQYDNANVIIVDWNAGSNTWNYVAAATNTRLVGLQIAKLFLSIKHLFYEPGKTKIIDSWGKIHLIGHSLGSHICGFAAKTLELSQPNQTESWIVDRITGLDPAQPCFVEADPDLKLTFDDAPFIDVIHTNAKQILYLGLGLLEQLGHIDFYPNGGKMQIGCYIPWHFWDNVLSTLNIVHRAVCSHGRSYEYFTESILDAINGNCALIGHRWNLTYEGSDELLHRSCDQDVCPELGINSINSFPRAAGTYFVPTGSKPLYCDVRKEDSEKIMEQLQFDRNEDRSFLTKLSRKAFGKPISRFRFLYQNGTGQLKDFN